MSKTITTRISNKTDTEQNWNSVDLIALNGELIVYSTDASHSSPRVKIGDGTTQVKDLPFIGATGDEATTSKAGLMSAADKEKMDSLGYENLLLNSAAEKTISGRAIMPVICDYGRTLLASRATRLVLTFEAKSDVATNVDAYPRKNTALSGMAETASVTTEWTNCSIVFSLPADSYTAWTIRSSKSVSGGSDTATVTIRNIRLVVTENEATTSSAGLMSSADKSKVDGIEAGANKYTLPTASSSTLGGVKTTSAVTSTSGLTACPIISGVPYYKDTDTKYTHPTSSGNKHIPDGGTSGQILRWSADGTAVWGADNNTTYSAATQSAQGLMSAADKKKLDNDVMLKSGGVFTGEVKAQNNTSYTTKQVRNVFLIADGQSLPSGSNGDLCFVYEA